MFPLKNISKSATKYLIGWSCTTR